MNYFLTSILMVGIIFGSATSHSEEDVPELRILNIENIPGPIQVIVDPPVFYTDRVEIGWHIPDVPFYTPFTFDVSGFDSTWGTCIGTQVEQDLEVIWQVGIEYPWWPYDGKGALCSSWWPPYHNDVWWPSRADVGTQGNNFLGTTIGIDGTYMGYHEFRPPVEYAYNDNGIYPHGPSDLYHDWLGTSGATINYVDPVGDGTFGPREQLDVSAPTIEVHVVGRGIVCMVFKLLGKTSCISSTLGRTLHGKVIYWRVP